MKKDCFDNLRNRFRFRRKNLKLSFAAISKETSVSPSTLWRFQSGRHLDPENALKIGAWLGLSVSAIFETGEGVIDEQADALGSIRELILNDEAIDENSRKDLWEWFEATYGTFTKTGG